MEMTGEYRIPASRETVWEALNDPEILKACIPGCQSLEKTADDAMSAVVQAKVGPVKATFNGNVTLQNLNPPTSYTIAGEGKGGVAGFAKGSADVNLAEHEGETLLSYTVSAQVGGKLAQLGSRLIDSTAKKYAEEFFSCLSEKVAGKQPEGGSAAGADAAAPKAAAAAPETKPAEAAPAEAEPEQKPESEHHESTFSEIEHEVEERFHEAEERLETEAGRGTLGGPWMWGLIAFAIVIVLLLIFN
ncbi:SRPBCC family protein [Amorphus orientalis]|uniref:Carbon monoxide dehydrogenase subunit G n=1 Tax=Amorphus orientalis TaxID=649198 RepID=A0AAE3VU43_9HYPH|nr:carbon monoxide dehydrogenase subunit G [Amorphus orientalis]MDQ0317646.1 carbon monoxide dehydrogenase subunit G [Amorphus orientalis]